MPDTEWAEYVAWVDREAAAGRDPGSWVPDWRRAVGPVAPGDDLAAREPGLRCLCPLSSAPAGRSRPLFV